MNDCPVCGKKLGEDWCCSNCGYDYSLDYLRYPTLSLTETGVSEESCRVSWEEKKNRMMLCPECGGIRFHYEKETQRLVCSDCGAATESFLTKATGGAQGLRAAKIAAGDWHSVHLLADGRVTAAGRNDAGQCQVAEWRDVVSVAAGRAHTLGLRRDGSVLAAGDNSRGQCAVSEWENVAAIRAAGDRSLAICKDGTVLVTGWNCSGLRAQSGFVDAAIGSWFLLLLRENSGLVYDGLNLNAECESLETWQDVVRIHARGSFAAGIRKNGTLLLVDSMNPALSAASGWQGIRELGIGENYLVGLKKDGTLALAGVPKIPQLLTDWKRVREIAVGRYHTVALTESGELLATGDNSFGQIELNVLTAKRV